MTTGNAVAYAFITLKGLSQSITSDDKGKYAIETKPGHLTVRVSAEGYATLQGYVTVQEGEVATSNFTLRDTINKLERRRS